MYAVAERLGMMVSDMMQRMTVAEFQGWCVYFDKQRREREAD